MCNRQCFQVIEEKKCFAWEYALEVGSGLATGWFVIMTNFAPHFFREKFSVFSVRIGRGISKLFRLPIMHVFCWVLCDNSVLLNREGWKLVSNLDSLVENIMQKRKAIKFRPQRKIYKSSRMHIKRFLFGYKMYHNLQKLQKLWRKIFPTCGDLYLKICVKFLGNVTRNKTVKDKKLTYVWIYFHWSFIIKEKNKMGDIKQKSCYRHNIKLWKDPSREIIKQEMWHTHPDNF